MARRSALSDLPPLPTQISKRGFASLSPERRRVIASKGGIAAHVAGTAPEWTKKEAIAAGRKGGAASRGGRGKLPTT